MKRILSMLLLLALSLLLATCTQLPEPPAPDYLALMCQAAARGDPAAGREAQQARELHIQETQSGEIPVSYEELVLLAQYMESRSGANWRSEDYRLCVGEVALNRLASPEFPDTLEEVLAELDFAAGKTAPDEATLQLALRLLLGERLLAPQVVHQQEEPEGSVYASFCNRRQQFAYFCESEYPRFYHLPKK